MASAVRKILFTAACFLGALVGDAAAKTTGAQQVRKLLQTTPPATTPQQQILTGALCLANQAAASAEQFAGLTGGKTGLPSVLNKAVGTSNNILATLEQQLSIRPASACSAAPPASTLNDAVKSIFCSTNAIVHQLETALGLGLPTAQQTAIQADVAQLTNAFNSIETGVIQFLFNIKC